MTMTASSAGVPLELRIKLAVRQYLKSIHLLNGHVPSDVEGNNVGYTCCNDDRFFLEHTIHLAHIQQRNPLPIPLFGGGMRFSPSCGVPIDFYREKTAPLYKPGRHWTDQELIDWDREEVESAVRSIIKAVVVRGLKLHMLSIHGPHCGWAGLLGHGLVQQIWLVTDGARELERRAQRGVWGPFRVYCTYHEHYQRPGQELQTHRTFPIRRAHQLFRKYSVEQMLAMSDREFLQREAMDWLSDRDPQLARELRAA